MNQVYMTRNLHDKNMFSFYYKIFGPGPNNTYGRYSWFCSIHGDQLYDLFGQEFHQTLMELKQGEMHPVDFNIKLGETE